MVKKCKIIHQTGDIDPTDWQTFYKKLHIPAKTFDFNNNIAPLYQTTDIIICRSGAGTLFETLFFQTPCITIPLETKSTDHQLDNAKEMAEKHPNIFHLIRQHEIVKSIGTFSLAINELILQNIKTRQNANLLAKSSARQLEQAK